MQANIRTNDLLNAVYFVEQDDGRHSGSAELCQHGTSGACGVQWSALVGEQYYKTKRALIMVEQLILRNIDFNIVAEHPHKYLLNFARTIKASRKVVQLAICVLNDSLVYTKLCVSHSAPEVAAGGLHLAYHLTGVASELPQQCGVAWWVALGIDTSQVEDVGAVLLDALATAAHVV